MADLAGERETRRSFRINEDGIFGSHKATAGGFETSHS